MFRNYTPVSGNDVKEIIEESVSKSYELYPIPMPTSLLHDCLDILLPHITYVVNDCLLSGSFPPDFKAAIVQPLLNKPSFDQNCPKSYRHLSNRFSSLRHFNKKKEKKVLKQLLDDLSFRSPLNPHQSANRAAHSILFRKQETSQGRSQAYSFAKRQQVNLHKDAQNLQDLK